MWICRACNGSGYNRYTGFFCSRCDGAGYHNATWPLVALVAIILSSAVAIYVIQHVAEARK